jgi:hypothetical protein
MSIKVLKYFLIVSVVFLSGCEQGLQPVGGIEGTITFPIDSVTQQIIWPDSLYGAVAVVAEFAYPFYTSLDSFFKHIIAYGEPIDTSQNEQDYFIQLKSGIYVVGVVGLKVPVAQIIFMPKDTLVSHPEYFQPIGLYKSVDSPLPISSINVRSGEVTSGIDITLQYDLVLPFK